jgi:enoyl-CoA hydratase/carnithine racemase
VNALRVTSDLEPLVLLERRNGVAFLTLNRPAQFNALSEQMLAAVRGTLATLAAESSVRVVVLGGAG